jgi:hypothetical protein
MLAVMTGLAADEMVVVQVVLGGRLNPFAIGSNPESYGLSWWQLLTGQSQSEAQQRAQQQRAACHGFRASIRLAAAGGSVSRQRQLVRGLFHAMDVVRLPGTGLWLQDGGAEDINQLGMPRRYPLRLSSGELVGLVGWPVGSRQVAGVLRRHPRGDPPRHELESSSPRIIGVLSGHRSQLVRLPERDGLMGAYLLGPTGSGKSTVMARLVDADIRAGRGVLVVDPKGDLADGVLARIPQERWHDVVVIDPMATRPVGFNPLHARHGAGEEITADGLVAVFHHLFADSWGIRTADILAACFHTLARIPESTLLWVTPLLCDQAFRRRVLDRLGWRDPLGIDGFWTQYEQTSIAQQAQMIGPVLNKLRQLLLKPSLRAVLGQAHPGFDPDDLLERHRVVILTTNPGLVGPGSAQLLSCLLLSQLWTRILARSAQPAASRDYVGVYLDEAQLSAGAFLGGLAQVLAMSRSQGVAWTLAHQNRTQLDRPTLDAIDANARSKIVFALAGQDALAMSRLMSPIEQEDLTALPRFDAYANLLQHGEPTGWIRVHTQPAGPPGVDPRTIRALSEQCYGGEPDTDGLPFAEQRQPDGMPRPDTGDEPLGRSRR